MPTANYSIVSGDCLEEMRKMAEGSVNCCVTSPPYFGLRDYGVDGQMGLEQTPDEYVALLVAVFHEARRVLRDDGTLWLNLGDSYAGGGHGGHSDNKAAIGVTGPRYNKPVGLKSKDLIGIPWRVAFALQADGWYLRQDIIWVKPNAMPESVTDRCTKSHEYVFLLSKSQSYYYDNEAVKEPAVSVGRIPGGNLKVDASRNDSGSDMTVPVAPMRNKRSVWTISTRPFKGAHFATFPEKLVEPCILAGCPSGGTVLDPFMGSGTTLAVAKRLGRNSVGIDLNHDYCEIARKRIEDVVIENKIAL